MKTKILVVEDDPDMFKALAIHLEANGFVPLLATTASSAVQIARIDSPQLVVLDLGLPDDRIPKPPIPVIVLTARDPKGNQEHSYETGVFDFFQKPVNPSWLLESIKKALEQSAPKETLPD
jgi:DNA-binding response OmpR family regulator